MSTRSTIAVQNENGSVSVVYCHFDGYLSGVGRTLAEHYTDREQVQSLLAWGDISALDQDIGRSVFYRRDRGESDTEARTFNTFEEYVAAGQWHEYNYFFSNGAWYVRSRAINDTFVLLTEAFEIAAASMAE
jgi:hypothetical protein